MMYLELWKNEVLQVKKLGEAISYERLMEIAHELWAQKCEENGLPRKMALCVAAEYEIKKEYREICNNRPPYGDFIRKVLAKVEESEEEDVKHDDSSPDPVDICDTDGWEYTYLVAFKRLGEGGGKTYRKINEKGEQR